MTSPSRPKLPTSTSKDLSSRLYPRISTSLTLPQGNLFAGIGVVRTLASYLPRMVLERFFKPHDASVSLELGGDEEMTEKDKRHLDKAEFPAAILFVDVSGFTSLNEKFAREGSGGIEKVTKHINGYFTQLVNMIHKHGGDVLKFAGDALIVAFGDRNIREDLRTYVLRATQCGVEIQRDLRSYDADGIRLTLHIAVGAGTLFTFNLGGINGHWEFFPAGSVFGQISAALDKSQSGQVYLSSAAFKLIEQDGDFIENTGDYLVNSLKTSIDPKPYTPTVQNIMQAAPSFEEDIRCYIGAGIQKRIDAGQSQWLAEMRRVSVIFVSLKGLSFQKEGTSSASDAEKHSKATLNPSSESSPSMPPLRSAPSTRGGLPHSKKPSDDLDITTPRVLSSGHSEEAEGSSDQPKTPVDVKEVVPDYKELNQVLRVVQKVIFRHDGFVRQFLVDDKGCTLIAVFGVPTTHPDDPIRAMAAALSIKNQLKSLRLKSYIGVTTGTAFCGTVGSADRQEYAVVGDIVNLSARLMVASYKGKHGILCDGPTNAMAADRFNLQPLTPIMVKGKSEPIPIFIPTRNKDGKDALKSGGLGGSGAGLKSLQTIKAGSLVERGVLHGRDAEKGLIYEQLEALGSLSSFAIICEGIAGIGKTRLGEELIDMARAKFGARSVAIGGGDSIDQDTPFLVFAHILQELYQLGPDAKHNEHEIKTAFVRIKDDDLRNDCFTFACFLNDILHADFTQSAAANKLATDSKQKIAMMHKIIRELLELAALEQPRVILIEDAQWIDPHSWSLLSDIVSSTSSLLLFVSTRPVAKDDKATPYSSFSALFNTAVVKLQPLLPEHILRIVRFAYKLTANTTATNPASGIPSEVASFLTTKAQGNPFFAKEIVKGLESQGAIAIDGGVIRILKPLSSVNIPENLKALIMSNFDQLSPNQQMVLKVASVLGKVISLDVLEAVFPEDAKKSCSISAEITKLLTDGVIVENNQTKQKNTYLFSSNLFQEVAYGMMLDSQRKALHKETALYYEREFQRTDMLSPCFNQIIYHFEHAGFSEKVEYYKERMEARKRWTYAYRLVSTVEFWGRKGVSTANSSPREDSIPKVVLEEAQDEARPVSAPKINVEVVDQLASFTPKVKHQ